MSGAKRIAITAPVDVSGLQHAMQDPARVTQYLQETTPGIPAIMGGSFTLTGYLCGHGSTTAGAVTASDLAAFLGWAVGANSVTFASGTTISGGASTVANLVTAASGTGAPGGLFRLGAKGDTDGDGQWNVIGTHTLTDLVPLFEVPAAPANAAVVYSANNVYTVEDSTAVAITGGRFQILTANNQYICHGCHPTAVSLTAGKPGEVPMWSVTIGVSWFEPRADTFPDVTALTTHTPAPVAGGSLNLQTVGTATRAALSVRDFSVDIQLGIAPLYGPDAPNAYARIVGARRTPSKIMVSMTVDAAAASTTPTYWTNWLAGSAYHLLYSMSTGDGTATALYMPRVYYRGDRPTQTDLDGLNRVRLSFEAGTGPTATSALTQSALRIGMA